MLPKSPHSNAIPELLAPVADWEMCQAAVHNGADAIYVGVPGYNARGRTPDLSADALTQIIEFCRLRGVRVYFAMNVLVFERELLGLEPFVRQLLDLQPDAFIVQDIGLARLLRAIDPAVEIHASTQMTLASAEAVERVASLGFSRFVLARELALSDIAQIRSRTDKELEVFVHGALCVAYSGQCLTSENFGGRSANRGQCAQSCRLDYELWVDGKSMDLQGRQWVFSPRDLCALPVLNDLRKCGVHSLKIEGRLKSPAYVAATVAAYRAELDGQVAQESDLEALFSRGFSTGWLRGVDHQTLVDGHYSGHRGERLGSVQRVTQGGIEVHGDSSCRAGDGVLLHNALTGEERGGRLYGAEQVRPGVLFLEFSREFPLRGLDVNWVAWRNDSPAAERRMRRTWTDRELQRRTPITMELQASEGMRARLRLTNGLTVEVQSALPLTPARGTIDEALWMRELTALGGTAYSCANFSHRREGNPYLDQRSLRQMRQEAVRLLDEQCLQRPRTAHNTSAVLPSPADFRKFTSAPIIASATTSTPAAGALTVLLRQPEQIEGLAGLELDTVLLDFEYGKDYRPALARLCQLGLRGGIATLRVHRPTDAHHLRVIRELRPEVVLVRNFGALHILADLGVELRGDHSLNITNSLSAQWALDQGLRLVQPGYDCNRDQLCDLLDSCSGELFEVGLHQYLPTFHMEHCVFASYLSRGSRFPDCGKVCETHAVEVRDRRGGVHRLCSDAECRNTLYLGKPQSALKLLGDLRSRGVGHFRLEMLSETPEQVRRKVETYLSVLAGTLEVAAAQTQLGVQETYGITEGQLFQKSVWVDRKKDGAVPVATPAPTALPVGKVVKARWVPPRR